MKSCWLDSAADVKPYDPKVVVIGRLDAEETIVKRFHTLDLGDLDLLRYKGISMKDADTEDEDEDEDDAQSSDSQPPELEHLNPDYLRTVSILTKGIIEKVIVNSKTFTPDGEFSNS